MIFFYLCSYSEASNNTRIFNTCTRSWITGSEQVTPVNSIKDVVQSSVKFPGFDTPEEGRKTYRPKRCVKNKDEDNSPKTHNDKNQHASSQKFRHLISFLSSFVIQICFHFDLKLFISILLLLASVISLYLLVLYLLQVPKLFYLRYHQCC